MSKELRRLDNENKRLRQRIQIDSDEDFEKASKVCSDTQLYKQAGNSIVVNVLMAILKNLLGGK